MDILLSLGLSIHQLIEQLDNVQPSFQAYFVRGKSTFLISNAWARPIKIGWILQEQVSLVGDFNCILSSQH